MELINYLHCVCVYVCVIILNLCVYLCECLRLHTAVAWSLRSQPPPGWNLIFCLLGSLTPLSPLLRPLSRCRDLGTSCPIIDCNCLFTSHLSHVHLSSVLLESSYLSPSTASDPSATERRALKLWCKLEPERSNAVFFYHFATWLRLLKLTSHASRLEFNSLKSCSDLILPRYSM